MRPTLEEVGIEAYVMGRGYDVPSRQRLLRQLLLHLPLRPRLAARGRHAGESRLQGGGRTRMA